MKASSRTPPAQTPIRIGFIDDHTLFRSSLAHVLDEEPDMTVVGEASGREEGLSMIKGGNGARGVPF